MFNPEKEMSFKILTDIGTPEYYKIRAMECVSEGNLKMAIQLLVMAIITEDK